MLPTVRQGFTELRGPRHGSGTGASTSGIPVVRQLSVGTVEQPDRCAVGVDHRMQIGVVEGAAQDREALQFARPDDYPLGLERGGVDETDRLPARRELHTREALVVSAADSPHRGMGSTNVSGQYT